MKKYLLKSLLPITIILLVASCFPIDTKAQTRDSLLSVYNNQTIHTFGKFYIKGASKSAFGI